MNNPSMEDLIQPILKRDPRYSEEAYFFVRKGLDFTVKKLNKPRHISGQELLDGMREYALKEFGPMAKRVLFELGIKECIDFGHIVFNLVDEGLLGKTEEDSIEDFADGYSFDTAFVAPFLPTQKDLNPTK